MMLTQYSSALHGQRDYEEAHKSKELLNYEEPCISFGNFGLSCGKLTGTG
jgi:hypothetical protein